jgi:hypothetical protein
MSVSNHSFICFFFDQTQRYCKKGAKWSKEYGGCLFCQSKIHWVASGDAKGQRNKFPLWEL